MNKISLEEAKQLQYEMLKEMHRACEQHGLRYYLAYGTLLGAIRHKGYIPWDDDIDVMMPREDFFKLAEIYHSDRYAVVSCYNDPSYEYAFGRMYDTNTAARKGKFETKGLCIDIYLLTAWPEDEAVRKRLAKKIRCFRKLRIYLIGIRNRLAVKRLWPWNTLNIPLLQWACKKEEMLRGKKYAISNLECPVTYGTEKRIRKCGSNLHCTEAGVSALRWAGIDYVTIWLFLQERSQIKAHLLKKR